MEYSIIYENIIILDFGKDSLALDCGHTHQGCTDAIGKMCVNPP
jgi:hypothetical protein